MSTERSLSDYTPDRTVAQWRVGNRYVSTIERDSSAMLAPGRYKETMAFEIAEDGSKKVIGGPWSFSVYIGWSGHSIGLRATFTDKELDWLCIDPSTLPTREEIEDE